VICFLNIWWNYLWLLKISTYDHLILTTFSFLISLFGYIYIAAKNERLPQRLPHCSSHNPDRTKFIHREDRRGKKCHQLRSQTKTNFIHREAIYTYFIHLEARRKKNHPSRRHTETNSPNERSQTGNFHLLRSQTGNLSSTGKPDSVF
jgi:hypothetical protein